MGYVIVHDFNFDRIRRAVSSLARDFEVVVPIGEGRRPPLDERPPGAGPRDGDKFAEAVVLRPRRLSKHAKGAADADVDKAIQALAQDADVTALFPSLLSDSAGEVALHEAASPP